MKKNALFPLIFLSLFFLTKTSTAIASIGVGVGIGKIYVEEKLKPGLIYELPTFTVLNTGDEPSEYEVSVTFNEKQDQLFPKSEWLSFTPNKFHLEPGEVKQVEVKLNLPLKIEPGDYFAYLEARPIKIQDSGTTSVNVAAAAKLYFTVTPASVLSAVYYKTVSFWKIYSPWTNIIAATIGFIIIVLIFRKFFHLEVNFKKKDNNEKST